MKHSYLWTYDLYGPVRNASDAGKSITRAVGGGWALEIETFLGPAKWRRAVRRWTFWAQKGRERVTMVARETLKLKGCLSGNGRWWLGRWWRLRRWWWERSLGGRFVYLELDSDDEVGEDGGEDGGECVSSHWKQIHGGQLRCLLFHHQNVQHTVILKLKLHKCKIYLTYGSGCTFLTHNIKLEIFTRLGHSASTQSMQSFCSNLVHFITSFSKFWSFKGTVQRDGSGRN